jgi:hypothetical protein
LPAAAGKARAQSAIAVHLEKSLREAVSAGIPL